MSDRPQRAIPQQLRAFRHAGVHPLTLKYPPRACAQRESNVATSSSMEPGAEANGIPTPKSPTGEATQQAPSIHDRSLFKEPNPQGDRTLAKRGEQLLRLQEEVKGCTRCPALVDNRSQTVFADGPLGARLCFLGEAPGADEDRQGVPFVGRSGQLLNDILKACGLPREEVYICNVLKCRPPENRTPTPEEVSNCRPFFERQLEWLRPEFICCLGSVAATALLNSKQPLGKMRGRFHDWKSIRVVVTYHPSYLLRNPSAKKDTWEDMKMLMAAMGREIPASGRGADR